MFENFQLKEAGDKKGINKKDGLKIVGYHWRQENPKGLVYIIHGLGEYAGRYDKRLAGTFLAEGYSLLSMDLRGHGISGGVRGHAAPRLDILADIDALIAYGESLYPDVPAFLYGHSMGGNIALDYRLRGSKRDSLRAYIISAPWLRLVKPVKFPLYQAGILLSKIKPDFALNSAIDEELLGNPESVGSYSKNPLVHDKVSALTAMENIRAADSILGTVPESAADLPFLLMHGTNDGVCDIEGSRHLAKLSGSCCTYVEWSGLSHEIHNGGGDSSGDEVIARMVEYAV